MSVARSLLSKVLVAPALLLAPSSALANGHNAVDEAAITGHRRVALETWAGFSGGEGDLWISGLHSPLPRLELSAAFGSDSPGTYTARYRVLQAKMLLRETANGRPGAALAIGMNMDGGLAQDYYVNLPITSLRSNRLALHVNVGWKHHIEEERERGLTGGVRTDWFLRDNLTLIAQLSGQPGLPGLLQLGPRFHFDGGRTAFDITIGQELSRGSIPRLWLALSREF
jgi:hypothetical protein